MAPAPKVSNRGPGPTGIESVTLFVFASTRVNMFFAGVVTQTAPSPYRTAAEPAGTSIVAKTEFVFGSMRESFPCASVTSQTASSLAAMPPSLSAGPAVDDEKVARLQRTDSQHRL